MSEQDKKEQAINPQPEHQEPSATGAPETDESRIGGQAVGQDAPGNQSAGVQVPGNRAEGEGVEQGGEGTGAKAGEYS